MNNKFLIYGAIGLGAYLLLGKKGNGNSGGEKTYTIRANQYPNVPAGTYKESELAQFGFVEYPIGSGTYFHQTQFVAPPNTDVTSPTWLNYLNTAINLGTTLYTTVTDVTAAANNKMKTTAVNWDNNIVSVNLAFGYASYIGFIDPTTNITKNAATLSIQIKSLGNQKVEIKFVRSEMSSTGQVTNSVIKQGMIDFATKTLTGFDAGSISGVYMAGFCNCYLQPDYDRPINIMGINGIGAISKKLTGKGSRAKNQYNAEVDAYKYFVYNLDNCKIESGFEYKEDAIDLANDYDNAKVLSLRQLKQMGLQDPRPNWKYIEGIGSTYDYMHPKAITHCFDGTYSDAGKGACSYHGGAHEIKLRKGQRDYTGKGKYEHYAPYRRQYKSNWAKNKDKVTTL